MKECILSVSCHAYQDYCVTGTGFSVQINQWNLTLTCLELKGKKWWGNQHRQTHNIMGKTGWKWNHLMHTPEHSKMLSQFFVSVRKVKAKVGHFISKYLLNLFLVSISCKRLQGVRRLREVYHCYQQLEKPIISKELKFAERMGQRTYHTSSSMAEPYWKWRTDHFYPLPISPQVSTNCIPPSHFW